jgi:hypothetical protein
MKNCLCITFAIFIFTSFFFGINEQNNLNNQSKIDKTYKKVLLQEMVMNEELKIINNIVKVITYSILYEANKGNTNYVWYDEHKKLNNLMYDKLFNEIELKFPDINLEESDKYTMKFDWS